jgi:hypothetical protein
MDGRIQGLEKRNQRADVDRDAEKRHREELAEVRTLVLSADLAKQRFFRANYIFILIGY